MPKVTVYIRDKDLDAWKSVIKKTEFIHNALEDRSTYDGAKIVLREELPSDDAPLEPQFRIDATKGTAVATQIIKTPSEAKAAAIAKIRERPKGRLCKHGSPRGDCFSKEAARLKCNAE